MKDSLKVMVDRLEMITAKVKETVVELDRLVLSIVSTIQSSFSWLESVADICNAQLGTPYERCNSAMNEGISDCKKHLGPDLSKLCDVALVAHAACYSVKPFKAFCYATDFMDEAILASVKKSNSNTSRSASQVAAGIVTEIRNRADPLLTWLSWSSCVTSLFLLLIIFRAKYYQHMYETRSRFDNRYVTKELQELDLKRQRQGRETVLPLNRRERAKYINTTSFRLVASEKVYLNRSAVFMAITTLKLLIHMVADYSLYWVLMTIRYHGRYQTELMPGIPHSGAHVSGSGYVARLFSSIIGILDIPLSFPAPSPITCLPDPYPPDLRRYTQIGVLIFLLWFFALFEPYGLRLRHLIMGHYRPERAKARATWLYNHILRTRGASLTFRQWVIDHIPFQCLKSLLGLNDKEPHCLLCGITSSTDPESELTRCHTRGCPGIYCLSCFQDIGALCTICMSPADYGDLSDVSLEKGSSDDSDSDHSDPGGLTMNENVPLLPMKEVTKRNLRKSSHSYDQRWQFFKETCPGDLFDAVDLPTNNNEHGSSATNILRRFHSLTSNLRILYKEKQYTLDWVTKVSSENTYNVMPEENNDDFDSSSFEMEDIFNETRSVGVNTDRNRGMIINILMNNFSQRRIQFFRNKHRNLKSSHKQQQGRHIVSETNRKTIMFTKTLHSYNLTIPKINTRNIKNKKTNKDKYKMNLSKEFKGTTSVMKYFMKSSDVVEVSNQNSNLPANHDNADNSPIDNTEETTDSIDNEDNADFSDKKKKKKLKNKKPKRQRKPKDVKKIKKKGSRQGINEIQTFFSTRWNNFKCSLMKPKRSDSPTAKEKKNHKRRKKRKGCIREIEETDTTECFGKKDIKQTRNLRISAFLAELEWSKKEYRKEKETGVNKDTFSFPDGSQRITTNKIIGMVHLKNLPFQWREAPKQDPHCDCQDKKCSCPEKSDKCMKIFGRLSKFSGRTNNKKNIEKFRNKISSMDAPSSLMAKMLSTINAKREKRTAEIVISHSKHAKCLDSSVVTSRCRCDFYDDLQRKWTHVKRSISDKFQTPISMLKNLRSSLFGPSCTKSTCPNKTENKVKPKIVREKKFFRIPGIRSMKKNKPVAIQTDKKSRSKIGQTQLTEDDEVEKCIKAEMKKRLQEISSSAQFDADACKKQMKMLLDCLNKETEKIAKSVESKSAKSGIVERPDTPPADKVKIAVEKRRSKSTPVKTDQSEVVEYPKSQPPSKDDVVIEKPTGRSAASPQSPQSPKKDDKVVEKKVVKAAPKSCPSENIECSEQHRKKDDIVVEKKMARPAPPKKSSHSGAIERSGTPSPTKDEIDTTRNKQKYAARRPGVERPGTQSPYKDCIPFEDKITKTNAQKPGNLRSRPTSKPDVAIGKKVSRSASPANPRLRLDDECEKRTDEGIQGVPQDTCTCATQHEMPYATRDRKRKPTTIKPLLVSSFTLGDEYPITTKKNEHKHAVHKGTKFSKDRRSKDKGKIHDFQNKSYNDRPTNSNSFEDEKSGVYRRDQKLSLESSLCILNRSSHTARQSAEVFTDPETDTSISSISFRSDETRTDTTICSIATVDYENSPRRRKFRVKVFTKTNQATLTDKTKLCDTGTVTQDWWSPLVERKSEEIIQDKKKGLVEKQKNNKEPKQWKELKLKKKRRNCGVTTDGRIVTFRSRTQIIPAGESSSKLSSFSRLTGSDSNLKC
ncbi:hypothetical protein HF086_008175 [Spodoptera exigua]|uniref:Dendritic cell-specific transmembrane protein-like domain-containing protein n=1 Tax=Spodoptera exigua TaxID=7107 RepID=A0A922SA85_SPOEX|nr:hypothetical protein HF086_008175 [Spodoptera exigua]